MAKSAIRKAEIRMLGPGSIEDFHAHLVRLDRTSRFPGEDDRAIDIHCLGLVAAGAILIGAFVDGVMRGAPRRRSPSKPGFAIAAWSAS